MKAIRKELPRNKKNCYAVTAWISVDEKDTYTFEVTGEYEVDVTVETDSVMDAILMMIGIDYAAEKKLKSIGMIDSACDYFTEHYGNLFNISLPWEDKDNRYISYRTIKYENGQETYEITLDKNDPFVRKVRAICDRIMEEFESLGEDDDYWSGDFMKDYQPYVNELRQEKVEWETTH